jgi:hypothetical protein
MHKMAQPHIHQQAAQACFSCYSFDVHKHNVVPRYEDTKGAASRNSYMLTFCASAHFACTAEIIPPILQKGSSASTAAMQRLLPLAVLCCMLAVQVAAGTPVLQDDGPRADTLSAGRDLLQTTAPIAVLLTRQQFVQASWALQDITCAGVAAKDRNFNNTLAVAVVQDFRNALTTAGWPNAPVVALRQPCFDLTVSRAKVVDTHCKVRRCSTFPADNLNLLTPGAAH